MKVSIGDKCYLTLKSYPVPLVISTLGGRMDLWVLNWSPLGEKIGSLRSEVVSQNAS